MAVNRNIKVTLHDNEYDFLKWLAKRDRVTVGEEMRMLFNLQLSEEMDLYEAEYNTERPCYRMGIDFATGEIKKFEWRNCKWEECQNKEG